MTDPGKQSCRPPAANRPRLAFVCPRLHEEGTVGGAETLIYSLAKGAAAAGCRTTFLTTCARNHFTWVNDLPPGEFERDGLTVRRFEVNTDRDTETFLRLQAAICRDEHLSDAQEVEWLRQSVNSATLIDYLQQQQAEFDHIIAGPYLFGLVEAVSRVAPTKTLLIPCLHDEAFARVRQIGAMFARVRGCLFNTAPERDLAHRLYPAFAPQVETVVAMGIEPFEADASAFARQHQLTAPYVLYSGRREPLKGTPLLIDYLDTFRQRTGRDLRLVLTGSGEVELPPSMRAATLDRGFVSEEEKRNAMAGAVAFCHPSVNESLGIVLIEAWLAGTPALVHAKGEVLRSQCRLAQGGLWFRDYPEFEEALLLLLDQPELRRALGANGRDFALRTYAPAAVTERFLAALEGGPGRQQTGAAAQTTSG